jgi:hypothetical protein
MMSRRAALVAVACILVALPVSTWWIVGDLAEEGGVDYMFHPPDISKTETRVIGVTATAVLIAGAVVVLGLARRGMLGIADLRTAVPLAAVGIYLGLGYRVVTAATDGANIGGGLVFMFGIFFVPVMLLLAVNQWRRTPHQADDPENIA